MSAARIDLIGDRDDSVTAHPIVSAFVRAVMESHAATPRA